MKFTRPWSFLLQPQSSKSLSNVGRIDNLIEYLDWKNRENAYNERTIWDRFNRWMGATTTLLYGALIVGGVLSFFFLPTPIWISVVIFDSTIAFLSFIFTAIEGRRMSKNHEQKEKLLEQEKYLFFGMDEIAHNIHTIIQEIQKIVSDLDKATKKQQNLYKKFSTIHNKRSELNNSYLAVLEEIQNIRLREKSLQKNKSKYDQMVTLQTKERMELLADKEALNNKKNKFAKQIEEKQTKIIELQKQEDTPQKNEQITLLHKEIQDIKDKQTNKETALEKRKTATDEKDKILDKLHQENSKEERHIESTLSTSIKTQENLIARKKALDTDYAEIEKEFSSSNALITEYKEKVANLTQKKYKLEQQYQQRLLPVKEVDDNPTRQENREMLEKSTLAANIYSNKFSQKELDRAIKNNENQVQSL